MSILGAMYAAVSGLDANSTTLSVISDNIANANTIGYKDTTADFSALVTQAGVSGEYSPGGVETTPFYNIAQQGAIQAASSPTDLAISGSGFFIVNSSAAGDSGEGTESFTQAGNFTVNANGDLVNSAGLYLQGEMLSASQIQAIASGAAPTLSDTTLNSLQTINVNNIGGAATPTANVTLAANLPANDTSTPETVTVPVYDSLGIEHDMTLTFTPSGTPNEWTVSGSLADGSGTVTIPSSDGTVVFNSDGTLDTAATGGTTFGSLSVDWNSSVTDAQSPQTINFNLGTADTTNGLSQLGSAFTVSNISQDGVQLGSFSSVSVGANGLVTANFSNGLTRAIALIPIATFENPDGLSAQSGDTYLNTVQSGPPLLSEAGSGTAGTIQPSSLEDSTVDIATEFSQLIIAQNAYEANSKVISTSSQMLQSLLGIQTA